MHDKDGAGLKSETVVANNIGCIKILKPWVYEMNFYVGYKHNWMFRNDSNSRLGIGRRKRGHGCQFFTNLFEPPYLSFVVNAKGGILIKKSVAFLQLR